MLKVVYCTFTPIQYILYLHTADIISTFLLFFSLICGLAKLVRVRLYHTLLSCILQLFALPSLPPPFPNPNMSNQGVLTLIAIISSIKLCDVTQL